MENSSLLFTYFQLYYVYEYEIWSLMKSRKQREGQYMFKLKSYIIVKFLSNRFNVLKPYRDKGYVSHGSHLRCRLEDMV